MLVAAAPPALQDFTDMNLHCADVHECAREQILGQKLKPMKNLNTVKLYYMYYICMYMYTVSKRKTSYEQILHTE